MAPRRLMRPFAHRAAAMLVVACVLGCGGRDAATGGGGPGAGAPPIGGTRECGPRTLVSGETVWGLNLAATGDGALFTTYGEGADGHDHALWRVSAEGGAPAVVWRGPSGILGAGLGVVDGRAYLPAELQWNGATQGVLAIPLDGSAAPTVAATFGTPCAAYGGVAFDATNVYAASIGCAVGEGQIVAIPRAGGAPSTVWSGSAAGDGARSLTTYGGDVYFVRDDDSDGDGAATRIAAAGGAPVTIADVEARGIAIDDDGVYLTVDDGVSFVPHDGSAAQTLASGLDTPGLVVVDATGVYVATGTLADSGSGAVVHIPAGGGAPVTIASGQATIFALAVDDTHVYWASEKGGAVIRADKCP